MLRERAECHSGQWLQLPRMAVGPDAFLPPPPSPTGQPGVLPAGRQLHTLPQLKVTWEGCSGQRHANRQDGIWPSSRSLGHPPPQEDQGFSDCWEAQQLHELDSQEPVTENSRKPSAAPGCAGLSSLLHSSCVFSRKTWVLTQFFSTLGKWWEHSEPRSSPVKWGDDSSLRDRHKTVFPSAGNGDPALIRWCIERALKDRESQAVLVFCLFPFFFFFSNSSYSQKKHLSRSRMCPSPLNTC